DHQLRLYVGASAVEPHRPPEPSPMQQVNVHCVGCHTAEKAVAQGGKVRTTTPESCDSCHSPGYGKVLEDWRAILARRIPETEQALGVVARAVAGAPEAQTALRHAQGKLQEVKAGHGVHNIGFALALLAEAQTEAVNLARRAGLALQVSGVPEAHVMKSNECRICHLRPPEGVLNFSGTSFPHGAHGRALEQCTECHTPRSDHGKTTITPQDCARCHGGLAMPHPAGFRRRAKEEMARAGVSTCAQCHKGERAAACQPCHSSPPPDLQWGEVTFSHQRHGKYPEIQCVSCHSRWPDHGRLVVNQQQCTQCHGGLEMPHPANWAEAHPAFVRERGIESCEKCHAGGMSGEFCATCHG
ncbi:MAG: cytochrome c3 family protein, partial [Thermoanaerobaculum sp.]|nr:cytochrome c3 family protein [Thermoanaerobaculum sp.]